MENRLGAVGRCWGLRREDIGDSLGGDEVEGNWTGGQIWGRQHPQKSHCHPEESATKGLNHSVLPVTHTFATPFPQGRSRSCAP
jgi:hypothetical protein